MVFLHAGSGGVALIPGVGVRLGALALEGFVIFAGVQGQAPGEAGGAGGADLAGHNGRPRAGIRVQRTGRSTRPVPGVD
jgi:hypothetical protein